MTRPMAKARIAAGRFVLFALLWVALTDNDPGARGFGVAAALAATLTSLWLLPDPLGWRLPRLLRLLPKLLWQSLMGGTDVAARALRPSLPIDPVIVDYPLRLPEGASRVFLANTVTLLPGTLSAQILERRLRVHALTRDPGLAARIAEIERDTAGLFGLDLGRTPRVPGARHG